MFPALMLLWAFGLLVAVFTTFGLAWVTHKGSVQFMTPKIYWKQVAALQTISTLISVVFAWWLLFSGLPANASPWVILVVQTTLTFSLGLIRQHDFYLKARAGSKRYRQMERRKQQTHKLNVLMSNPDSPEAAEIRKKAIESLRNERSDLQRPLEVFAAHDANHGVVRKDNL